MARLTTEKAKERLLTPLNAAYIYQARKHEQRLLLHTEPILETGLLPGGAYNDFCAWVKSMLPEDKYKRFIQLMTLPLDTAESTKSIFDELNKFMDAQDRYIKYEFVSEEVEKDFSEYQETIRESNFWRSKGLDALKAGVCSFAVIDLPATQIGERPDPYFYLLSINKVIDVQINEDSGKVEYIIFSERENEALVFDDAFFRLFVKNEDSKDWQLKFEVPHSMYNDARATEVDGYITGGELVDGLGYTPVCSFYDLPIKGTRGINKRSPITDVLGKLDWLLFWRTSQKYLNLYAPFPIMVAHEQECTYRDEHGSECHDGRLDTKYFNGIDMVPVTIACPVCSRKNTIGAGSYYEVKAPRDKDDADLMENPIKFIEVSNDKLTYGDDKTSLLENEIYLSCVGFDGDAMNKEAVNETQVSANFESKEAVLDRIKTQFEKTIKFVNETVARLRYGSYFIKGTVDLGNEYFLKSAEELTETLKLSKQVGLPQYYIADLREQITRTKFKNNPEKLQRYLILQQLEPYPDMTVGEASALADADPIQYYIKLNFNTFIQRFEREQTNVVQFASLISFDKKINLINQKLQDYARERQATAIARTDTKSNAGT